MLDAIAAPFHLNNAGCRAMRCLLAGELRAIAGVHSVEIDRQRTLRRAKRLPASIVRRLFPIGKLHQHAVARLRVDEGL